jgi:hypothetical protein
MTEAGQIGVSCRHPVAVDDVHVLRNKMAVLHRETSFGIDESGVGALYLTTLCASSPKVMLNVETGDCGVLETRDCECPIAGLGFRQHLHTVRSYEKLTSEGMHFLGSDLLTLVEEVLPHGYGGHPTDFQFLEQQQGGLPKIKILISPRVGPVDEAKLVGEVLQFLGSRSRANRMMSERWREGQTLEVERREPYKTSSSKILPLHIATGN